MQVKPVLLITHSTNFLLPLLFCVLFYYISLACFEHVFLELKSLSWSELLLKKSVFVSSLSLHQFENERKYKNNETRQDKRLQ